MCDTRCGLIILIDSLGIMSKTSSKLDVLASYKQLLLTMSILIWHSVLTRSIRFGVISTINFSISIANSSASLDGNLFLQNLEGMKITFSDKRLRRKRLVKLLMAGGHSRNAANCISRSWGWNYAKNYLRYATGEYTIRPSWKNTEFDDEYPLREDQKRSILKSLTVDDCIKVEANSNSRYEESELFFFLKDATFNVYGEETTVKLYLKMYIRETKTHNMVIVISFHKNGLFD